MPDWKDTCRKRTRRTWALKEREDAKMQTVSFHKYISGWMECALCQTTSFMPFSDVPCREKAIAGKRVKKIYTRLSVSTDGYNRFKEFIRELDSTYCILFQGEGARLPRYFQKTSVEAKCPLQTINDLVLTNPAPPSPTVCKMSLHGWKTGEPG